MGLLDRFLKKTIIEPLKDELKGEVVKDFDLTLVPFRFAQPPAKKASQYIEAYKGWVYANIAAQADDVADIIFKLYRAVRRGGKMEVQEVTEHPLLELLYQVNPNMTKHELIYTTVAHLRLLGEAMWYLVRKNPNNPKELPTEIYPLRPDRVKVMPGDLSKGQFISHYEYTVYGKEKTRFEPWEILFLKTPNPKNPYRGLGVIEAAATTLDIEEYSEMWNRNFFFNSAQPDAVLYTDQKLTPETIERLARSWASSYQGVERARRTAILEQGLKYEKIQMSAQEMQFLEGQKWTRDKIMAMFRNTKIALGIVDDVNRANAEASEYVHMRNVIRPIMKRIVEFLNEFLVPLYGEDLFLDFEDPVPESVELKLKGYEAGWNKWLTINEIRTMEGYEPVEGGDVIYMPINLMPVGSPPETKVIKLRATKKLRKKQKDFTEQLMMLQNRNVKLKRLKAEFSEKLIKVLKNRFKKPAVKVEKKEFEHPEVKFYKAITNLSEKWRKLLSSKIDKVMAWQLEEILGKLAKKYKAVSDYLFDKKEGIQMTIDLSTPVIRELVKEMGNQAYDYLGIPDEYPETSTALSFVKKSTYEFAKSFNDTVTDRVKNELKEGMTAGEGVDEISRRLRDVFDELRDWEVDRIARTEVMRASNFGTMDAYQEAGIKYKKWFTAPDACEACLEHEGEIIGIEDDFFDAEYGSGEYPPLHPNSYHKDTEAYTKDGFKKIKDIKVGEDVLSLNPETKDLEWVKVKNLISHFQDKLISFKSRNFDLEVTPEHSMFYQKRWDRRQGKEAFGFIEAKKLPSEAIFYRSSEWKGKDVEFDTFGLTKEDFCRFMGYYLSEGSIARDKIYIAQSGDKRQEMADDLYSMNLDVKEYKQVFEIKNKELSDYLKQFGHSHQKYIPVEIKQLPPAYLRLFLDAFRLGDGSTRKSKKFKNGDFSDELVYFTASKKLADDIGELILKTGRRPSYYLQKNKGKIVKHRNGNYSGNYDIWVIRECYSQYAYSNNLKIKTIDYNDYVYCVELEKNHTLYVRKNGKCVWCGNCRCVIVPSVEGPTKQMKSKKKPEEGKNDIEEEIKKILEE